LVLSSPRHLSNITWTTASLSTSHIDIFPTSPAVFLLPSFYLSFPSIFLSHSLQFTQFIHTALLLLPIPLFLNSSTFLSIPFCLPIVIRILFLPYSSNGVKVVWHCHKHVSILHYHQSSHLIMTITTNINIIIIIRIIITLSSPVRSPPSPSL